ncbi:MAG TPA: FMN-dependent NADH-azoreductase [Candidatus Methylacidiphilales bacterium]|jgi:FMN-dependent NADH-azoreductase|nr:FMN-dependent NADH-azoreductase [Candidatus Methylacidiphilales bacterium]
MSTILVVTASPRGDRSVSRSLTTAFIDLWRQRHPGDRILLRDVGHHPVPHVTEAWMVGAFAPMDAQTPESKEAIAVSDSLVEEFLSADRYVFGVPMHNFNVPSTFKAYIDQIVRPGKTFGVGPRGYEGLVTGRKGLFITASGGAYTPGSAAAALNFQEPYLRTIFGFIGLTDLQFVTADNLNQGADAARQSKERAENALRELAAAW